MIHEAVYIPLVTILYLSTCECVVVVVVIPIFIVEYPVYDLLLSSSW